MLSLAYFFLYFFSFHLEIFVRFLYLFTLTASILDNLMSRPFCLEKVLSAPIVTDLEPCMNKVKFQQLRSSANVQSPRLNPEEADSLH